MFSFLKKDPSEKLQKQYNEKLEAAMSAQRNGDMRLYAELSAEADELYKSLQELKAS